MVHSEKASIQFLKWDPLYNEEKPFQVFLERDLTSEKQRNTNLVWEERDVIVEDFRNNADYLDIDNHGFTYRELPGFYQLRDLDTVEEQYIPALRNLLQKEFSNAGTVFVYDWRIRDSATAYPDGRMNFGDQSQSLRPSNFAHVDMAPISIVGRIRKSFPKDADRIFEQRIRAINVWKPLVNPVDQWALAVCDGNTIPPETLIETDSVRRENITTLYYATHAPEQKWHFLHRQTPEEALIFKHYDSKEDVKATFAMHSAIRHHEVSPDAKVRRSIEVRTLVFDEKFEVSEEDGSPEA